LTSSLSMKFLLDSIFNVIVSLSLLPQKGDIWIRTLNGINAV
jgi:uncharacterized membrane protein HdeD (DUF308 family)